MCGATDSIRQVRFSRTLLCVCGLGVFVNLVLTHAVPSNAAEPLRLTGDGQIKRDPVFLKSDGSELLFVQLDRPNRLRLMKLSLRDNSVSALHPEETRAEFEPAVSADGRWLAFVQNRGNLSLALVIQDLKDNKQTEVPPGGGFSGMHSPAISPDGATILFSYPEEGRQHLFSVSNQATGQRRLVDSVGVNNWPSFSPDGKQVVFGSTRNGDYDLFVMNADGTAVRPLVENPKQDIRPRWSPDGKRIAFTSNRDGNYELYVIHADGSRLVRLTEHTEQDDYACWHPDGRHLIAVCERNGHFDLYQFPVPE